MATNEKGKTKVTGAKGKTKATGLKEFLSNLATDPRKLGEFLHEPEAAMSAAKLSEADKIALRSGVAGMVAARLAGLPLDQAFSQKLVHFMIHPHAVAPQYVVQPPPQYVVQPWYMIHPIAAAPQYVVQPPPQYAVQPSYMIHPISVTPQYVVQPPPQYPR